MYAPRHGALATLTQLSAVMTHLLPTDHNVDRGINTTPAHCCHVASGEALMLRTIAHCIVVTCVAELVSYGACCVAECGIMVASMISANDRRCTGAPCSALSTAACPLSHGANEDMYASHSAVTSGCAVRRFDFSEGAGTRGRMFRPTSDQWSK